MIAQMVAALLAILKDTKMIDKIGGSIALGLFWLFIGIIVNIIVFDLPKLIKKVWELI